MAKLTQEKINEIIKVYNEIGTYSGTASKVGCSPATVKKYVMAGAQVQEILPKNITPFSGKIKDIEDIDFGAVEDIGKLSLLTEEEKEEIYELWEEI